MLVERLVPFVKAADVERSVAFYEHLGFVLGDTAAFGGRLSWATLANGSAEIMFEATNEQLDPERQGVLFYLYSDELAALRARLLAAGVDAGEIVDGTPGPEEEMRVIDPDGYTLMIAQTDSHGRSSN